MIGIPCRRAWAFGADEIRLGVADGMFEFRAVGVVEVCHYVNE